MLGLGWVVEKDSFLASTPMGMKKMVTVVASLNPRNGVCLLDLAAHFESKFFGAFKFVGATDSAAPVGIMLHLAQVLTPLFKSCVCVCV